MADIEEAIKVTLGAYSPLTTLVSTRINPAVSKQGDPMPRLVFSVLRDSANQPSGMWPGLFNTAFRFDAWGETPESALAVVNAVCDCFQAFLQAVKDGGSQIVAGLSIGGILFEDRMGPFLDQVSNYFKETIDFRFLHN